MRWVQRLAIGIQVRLATGSESKPSELFSGSCVITGRYLRCLEKQMDQLSSFDLLVSPSWIQIDYRNLNYS